MIITVAVSNAVVDLVGNNSIHLENCATEDEMHRLDQFNGPVPSNALLELTGHSCK